MTLFIIAAGFLFAATVFTFTPAARNMQAVDWMDDVVYPALSVLPPAEDDAQDRWETKH